MLKRGGLGSLRVKPSDGRIICSATSSGRIDAGIPILLSKNVSSSIKRHFEKNPLLEVDLRGTLMPIPFTYEYQYRREHIPRLCLLVNSILNVKKFICDFRLIGNAWTIYHMRKRKENIFGYTYSAFNPIDESSIINSTDWINNYIDEYSKGKGIPLTDYDEIVPRFDSAALTLQDVMSGNVDYDALTKLFGGIDFRAQNPVNDRMYY